MHCTYLLKHFKDATKMEFLKGGISIHVWSLYAVTLCTRSCELPDATTNRLVVAGTDVPEFIHTNTSCAALQQKLHECD